MLQWTQQYLAQRGVDEARLATEVLLSHALNCRKIELYTRFDSVPDADKRAAFRELVKAAADHAPVAYLVGHKEFFSLEFEVTPAVLIPRPETEMLVMRALQLCEEHGWEAPQFLDVGTGSGCLAVAILKHLPAAKAVAIDISAQALEVAQRNASEHEVAERVVFAQADRLGLSAGLVPDDGFDFLVSNPPYVSVAEMATLPKNVRDHEPAVALTVEGDGLSFYRTFADTGGTILRVGGSILVEIGYGKEEAVVGIFSRTGCWEHVGTWRDPQDPHDRVMEFRLKEARGIRQEA
ncbi:MAG: peptide chain release factor N(5)-glutamine methyltransferase [Phycisphaerae bacterium]|nr:peptide chain release factor N(5)-glutamine methyltransferase [Phycisphaerae bacterium]